MQYLGAKGFKDESLLEHIAPDFDVLITMDGMMPFQQNLKIYPRLAFILITAGDGSVKRLLPLVPAIRAALEAIQPGQWLRVP